MSKEVTAPSAAVEELPRVVVRRLIKEKLVQLRRGGDEDVNVQKEALLAFAESARIFIHYLSATASDVCKESKRQTMNAEDVLKALEEIDFPDFIEPLRHSLQGRDLAEYLVNKVYESANYANATPRLPEEECNEKGRRKGQGSTKETENGRRINIRE
ncbi:DNA polymerase epsilon subunit 3 isoform X2 [Dioscorea cayenensis subsp. rotundata]|uniref:DNA polymerase epsilon subunit 3 isoform X2 n=1 Tax=Dioscorea cayennensis subsp. rotundata TaxID=55577 RepID=A0AB40ATR1_DIOCR|nr:DNA polymerase epsilon subunit 3 isoform X2 [Dioscorea cayenensis subsp. rotundata]